MRREIRNIIDGDGSLLSKMYSYAMIASIVMSVIPLMFREQTTILVVMDVVACLLFVVDYVLRWCTCNVRNPRAHKLNYFIYPLTPMAIADLASILPTLGVISQSFKVFKSFRLLKLLRVIKFFRYYKPLQMMVKVFRNESQKLLVVVTFALFYIFMTALVMFNSEEYIDPASGSVMFEDFGDALYWSTCTLTTVGYGDIHPVSAVGRAISMVSALVGIAIVALPSGILTAGYMQELSAEREMCEKQKRRMDKEEISESNKVKNYKTDDE